MVSLLTNTEEYFADLCDEIRLFFDVRKIPVVQEIDKQGFCVVHEFTKQTEFCHHAALYLDGVRVKEYAYHSPLVSDANELAYKRAAKHGAKIAVYRCLSAYFGIQKAWGSLTGVRPTKMLRDLCMSYGAEQAEQMFLKDYDVSEGKLQLAKQICDIQIPILQTVEPQKDLDMYLGIPFCTSRCAYCSFYAATTTKDGNKEQAYVDALLRELALLQPVIEAHRVRSIYIGGGTPTALNAEQLYRVLKAVSAYAAGAEFTVEAGRPDTITQEKLAAIQEAGAQRISINPQTTCARTLPIIGRKHSVESFFEAAELAKKFNFEAINMDLIAGLPGEGEKELMQSVRDCVRLQPENITVHSLAIKKGSKFGMENVGQFAGAEEAERMVEQARMYLAEQGYQPYYMYRQKYMAGNMENIGYARPGKVCIYNVDIMEEAVSILALGAGSASKRVLPAQGKIERFIGLKDIPSYLARVEEMAAKKAVLFAQG